MRYFRRRGDTSNTVVGIVLIIVLGVFVAPTLFPTLLSSTLPFVDESIPCSRLRTAQNRAAHQSLIGISSQDPLLLRVQPDPVPVSGDGTWVVRIVVQNMTIGTVPIVYEESQVIVGDDANSSGLGLVFNPPASVSTGGNRTNANVNSFPENTIKLLGPRQRCVHRAEFQASQLDTTIRNGGSSVSAYYRITSPGSTTSPNPNATPIFQQQGLDIITGGIVRSEAVPIPIFATAN